MTQRSSRNVAGAALALILLAPSLLAQAAAGDAKSRGFKVVSDAAYVAPAPPPPPKPLTRRYDVPAETPLRQVLQQWASAEGWSVYWPPAADGSDWVTEVGVSFTATDFQQAASMVIEGLPPNVGLAATFNRANSPMLLHVSESPSMQEVR